MPAIAIKTKAEAYDVPAPKISENSYLGDVLTSEDKEAPLTAGFFKVVPGKELVYTYPYDEFKIIQEIKGDFIVSDGEGNVTHPKVGDVLYLPKGATITFKVEGDEDSYAYAFYVGKKALNKL